MQVMLSQRKKLLLHVARDTDTGLSAPFIASGNEDGPKTTGARESNPEHMFSLTKIEEPTAITLDAEGKADNNTKEQVGSFLPNLFSLEGGLLTPDVNSGHELFFMRQPFS